MNADDKAFPTVGTTHDMTLGGIRHSIESNGGLTKREFAVIMITCGFIANGKTFTVDDINQQVDKVIQATA